MSASPTSTRVPDLECLSIRQWLVNAEEAKREHFPLQLPRQDAHLFAIPPVLLRAVKRTPVSEIIALLKVGEAACTSSYLSLDPLL